MTRFPTMRRYMRTSAIAVPVLLFSAFLLIASGHGVFALAPSVGAIILLLSFPFYMPENFVRRAETVESGRGALRWVRDVAEITIIFWFVWQPEFESFTRRVGEGGALWDWGLIVPIAVLTLSFAIQGWSRVSRISDLAIYAYFTPTSPNHPQS